MLAPLVLSAAALCLSVARAAGPGAVREAFCRPNQVVGKVTVYEDGAIEAECGPMPCGASGPQCVEDVAACKSEADSVFSGMKWGRNGQSLALRCCALSVPNKIYVGTDLVGLGSYYTGGLVSKKEMFGHAGPEFDYVSNIRAEQGGVRIWVYRIMCPVQDAAPAQLPSEHRAAPPQVLTPEQRRQNVLQQLSQQQQQQQQQQPESSAEPAAPVAAQEDAPAEETPVNPLQYRPPARQKDSPMHASRRVL